MEPGRFENTTTEHESETNFSILIEKHILTENYKLLLLYIFSIEKKILITSLKTEDSKSWKKILVSEDKTNSILSLLINVGHNKYGLNKLTDSPKAFHS